MIKYAGYKCRIQIGFYPNGYIGLKLIEASTGAHIGNATIQPIDININEDELLIKNDMYSSDLLIDLIEDKVVEDTKRRINMNGNEIPICRFIG